MTQSGTAGSFTSSSSTFIVFNASGTPLSLADKNGPTPQQFLGTVAVSVKDADVTGVRIIVKK